MDGYSGDASNALMTTYAENWKSNGMKFSTPDSDNDDYPGGACAVNSGWWFKKCSTSNINILADSIWVAGNAVWDVQTSRMLVKLS